MRHSGPAESSERGATTPAPSHSRSAFSRSFSAFSALKLRLLSTRPHHMPPDWLSIAAIVLSLAYYYAVPSPLLSLPGLLAFIVLAWLRLDLALCLLPLTFPFWFVPKRVGGSVVFPLSEIALGVCFAVALARGVRSLILGSPPYADMAATGQSVAPAPVPLASRRSAATPATTIGVGALPAAPKVGQHDVPRDRKTGDEPPRRVVVALMKIMARLLRAGAPILIGAGLLLLGTALGVLVARRPHEALRAFRWEVA